MLELHLSQRCVLEPYLSQSCVLEPDLSQRCVLEPHLSNDRCDVAGNSFQQSGPGEKIIRSARLNKLAAYRTRQG